MTDNSTLIDFPTDFIIKVFGPNQQDFIDEISQLSIEHCEEPDTPKFAHQLSKNRQYVSISVTVYVTSKTNLDKIYQALTKHPLVKMVI